MNILADILSATLLFAVPLLLVALGGMFSERSGVINIALEGIMVVGALISCLLLRAMDLSGFGPQYPQLAVLIAIVVAGLTGVVYSLLLAFASINLKADQTIGGTALNMLAPAFAVVLTWAIQGQGNTTILIPGWVRMSLESFGYVRVDNALLRLAEQSGGLVKIGESMVKLAVEGEGMVRVGSSLAQVGESMVRMAGDSVTVISHNQFFLRMIFKSMYLTTPIAFVLMGISAFVMYKTKLGLRLRACGEHPQAADSVGVNVYRMRYVGVMISGFLAGIGGLAFTVAAGSGFQSQVAGYGFLALAVMIFGNWKPLSILGASLFFAFFKIIGSYSSSIPFLPDFKGISSSEYIYLMLPYVVTMIVLILTSRKSRAPKAEGIPYDKGAR